MLSHLRFHRRGHSNPSSPVPDQQPGSPFDSQLSPFPSDGFSPQDGRPPSSSSSALPPSLPPIARVTSAGNEPQAQVEGRIEQRRDADKTRPAQYTDSGFIGGVALRNYQRDRRVQAPSGSGRVDRNDTHTDTNMEESSPRSGSTAEPSPIDVHLTRPPARPPVPPKTVASFTTPTELHSSSASNLTGRRPAGTRLTTEPPTLPSAAPNEPLKPKKGLPFLKNPMSTLLMRRKNVQYVPDSVPTTQSNRPEEPVYDPRIKGTRVHDFSAPRNTNTVVRNNVGSMRSTSHPDLLQYQRNQMALDARHQAGGTHLPPRQYSNASDSPQSGTMSAISEKLGQSPSLSSRRTKESIPEQDEPKEESASVTLASGSSRAPSSHKVSRMNSQNLAKAPETVRSVRSPRSRNVSLSEMGPKDVPLSNIPKHMKSTSSRFSFDMNGTTQQEKLLEDRHRQRELEKQAADPRDSRFDEFDEDSFDYDAMMDDDGLEERIPGVNADWEEEEEDDGFLVGDEVPVDEELDPDDDQQNFSGFVFQRSNPTSSFASPQSSGMVPTPRDNDGKVIGFAMTKDTPNLRDLGLATEAPTVVPTPSKPPESASGLGIQGLDLATSSKLVEDGANAQTEHAHVGAKESEQSGQDDLYFDDGLMNMRDEFADELDFSHDHDEEPFDESLFDLDDTDQYGRPLPGAFAKAQSSRRVAKASSGKRESDMTSRLSAQSGISESTAHTSMSVDAKQLKSSGDPTTSQPSRPSKDLESSQPVQPSHVEGGSMAAYQAALAAAANAAEASGKFQRSTSPPLAAGLESGAQSDIPYDTLNEDMGNGLEDDYGQSYYDDFNDYELDDDAIIAEANASALANDSDGWYGQEFGFYSAPGSGHHGNNNATSTPAYEFANGGFFGPKGMSDLDRTTSGRMVSREPNLTPITERSEYSNRNSLMSLMPPLGPGTPTMQSPGLAQLAMLAEHDDDQMNLSALLRLRSRAWGGSQASLVSSKDGSPRSDRGDGPQVPWKANNQAGFSGSYSGAGRQSSVYSSMSRESEPNSPPGSPTLTSGIPGLLSSSPGTGQEQDDSSVGVDEVHSVVAPIVSPQPKHVHTNILSSPGATEPPAIDWAKSQETAWANMSSRPAGKGHRHQTSADSISYVKEEESGETRWVLERRRTGDTGEVEILEREVVEGGRI